MLRRKIPIGQHWLSVYLFSSASFSTIKNLLGSHPSDKWNKNHCLSRTPSKGWWWWWCNAPESPPVTFRVAHAKVRRRKTPTCWPRTRKFNMRWSNSYFDVLLMQCHSGMWLHKFKSVQVTRSLLLACLFFIFSNFLVVYQRLQYSLYYVIL